MSDWAVRLAGVSGLLGALWALRGAGRRQRPTPEYRAANPWWILPCLDWVRRGSGPAPLQPPAAPPAPVEQFGAPARGCFLLEPGMAYLNHGSYGATLRCALDAKEWWVRRMESEPVRFMDAEVLPAMAAAQRALAQFVHAAPEDLALVPNATTAVNAVLGSLELSPGDVVLGLDISYGAVLSSLDYACTKARARLVQVRVPWPLSDDRLLAAVEAALDDEPRAVFMLIDHVTSCPAVLLPVERVCALCRQRGVSTMVDGAHAVGSMRLDVPAIGADAYTSNCHKWLCTPKGTAFLWLRKGPFQERTRPTVISHGYGLGFVREFMWVATCDYVSGLVGRVSDRGDRRPFWA